MRTVRDVTTTDMRFAVVDVETTGLSPRRHRLLQVAVVLVDVDGHVLDRWSSYVRPRWGRFSRLGPRHVHGITHRQLRGAPHIDAVIVEVASRLEGAVLTAHNLPFDLAFLQAAAQRSGTTLPAVPGLCTLDLSRRLDPDRQLRHRLGDLCERHGVTVLRPHDALADADATALVVPHLLAAHGVATRDQLDELLAASSSASSR
jgi:DNA polymerase-3 subunit epsilon